MMKGTRELQEGKYYLAANTFDSAALYWPENPTVYLAKSHALFAAGEYMSAAWFINEALQLDPQIAQSSQNPVGIFPSEEEFQKRLDDLKHWQEITNRPELHFLLGLLQWQTGHPEEAKTSLNNALQAKIAPNSELAQSINLILNVVDSGPENNK